MPTKRFICLANSRKNGYRCVAGIDEDDNWIRLVNDGGSELSNYDIKDSEGNKPQLLETWDVEVIEREPLYYQPENWIIDPSKWWSESDDEIYPNLNYYLDDFYEYIFIDNSDRLSPAKIDEAGLDQSLMLIHLSSIVFQKTTNQYNHLQIRAKFEYNDHFYDLVVTDDKWEAQFSGPHAHYSNFGDYEFDSEFYLTIGIGTKFHGYHYKLVVAVMPLEDVEEKQAEWD